jgi:hypothetical protein
MQHVTGTRWRWGLGPLLFGVAAHLQRTSHRTLSRRVPSPSPKRPRWTQACRTPAARLGSIGAVHLRDCIPYMPGAVGRLTAGAVQTANAPFIRDNGFITHCMLIPARYLGRFK